MAVFGKILSDECIQLDDLFKIDVSRYNATPDENGVTLVEVDPDNSGTFYDASEELSLVWSYPASGVYTIAMRVTTDIGNIVTFTKDVEVKAPSDECFFADDEDLKDFEPDIYDCLPCHRCSFTYIHRKVANCIMECLRQDGLLHDGCEPVDLTNLKSSESLRKLAAYWALECIFRSFSKSQDDFWYDRAKHYKSMMNKQLGSYKLFYDKNGNGTIEPDEYRVRSNRLIR